MARKTTAVINHFHRMQILRAQKYIELNFKDNLSLKKISKEAGSSEYHFARIFMSYTGETTFACIRRTRIVQALKSLQKQNVSITDIGLDVGYETPSAFNKAFKIVTSTSPRYFRNLGKEEQQKIIHSCKKPNLQKEKYPMNLDLNYTIVERPQTHILCVEKNGLFQEVALPAWYELIPAVDKYVNKDTIQEYLGFSIMNKLANSEKQMQYLAAVSSKNTNISAPQGLISKKMPGGTYAKFTMVGPTHLVWPAFNLIFQLLTKKNITLRPGACIENYLSNPEVVPENELVTELLVPIEV